MSFSDGFPGVRGATGARGLRPAVFFDRDGVLNVDDAEGGVADPQEVKAIPGAGAALARVNAAGVPAICVTNQPGLAKGVLTGPALEGIMAALARQLQTDGGRLDDVFWCPHHPDRSWPGGVPALLLDCDCRKPKPGLMIAAAERHGLDLARSWVIGDRYRDLAAGRAVGARGVLVLTGEKGSDADRFAFAPDFIAGDLAAAVDHVLIRITSP